MSNRIVMQTEACEEIRAGFRNSGRQLATMGEDLLRAQDNAMSGVGEFANDFSIVGDSFGQSWTAVLSTLSEEALRISANIGVTMVNFRIVDEALADSVTP